MAESHLVQRTTCPVCKSSRIQQVYAAKFAKPPISDYLKNYYAAKGRIELGYLVHADFVLDECDECRLVYQRFIPDEFLGQRLYEVWIDAEQVLRSKVRNRGLDYYVRLRREVERVINRFGSRPAELAFFDFGMGWGDWCRMAMAHGCTAYGTEMSQVRVTYARKSGVNVLEWHEIPAHRFDFINAEQVFEHLPDPLEALRYLVGSMKPDGLIKVSVPNGWDIKRRLAIGDWSAPKGSKNSLNPVAPLEHINCFSRRSLLHMARIVDLVPILDFTLRDIPWPLRWFKRWKSDRRGGSTCIFFRRQT